MRTFLKIERQPPAGVPVPEAGSEAGQAGLRPGAGVLAHMLQMAQPDAVVSPHLDPLLGRRDGVLFHLAVSVVSGRGKALRSGSHVATRPAGDELRRGVASAKRRTPPAAAIASLTQARRQAPCARSGNKFAIVRRAGDSWRAA